MVVLTALQPLRKISFPSSPSRRNGELPSRDTGWLAGHFCAPNLHPLNLLSSCAERAQHAQSKDPYPLQNATRRVFSTPRHGV